MGTFLQKPIFILGSGRSGTTLLYDLLAVHPDVCWFSEFTNKFPHLAHGAYIQRILNAPLLGDLLRQEIIKEAAPFIVRPSEGEYIYDNYCGFIKDRRATEKDKTKEIENAFREIISRHVSETGRERFINKQPANTQRVRLINSMFPDAYFVHIIRDGRAVSNSLLHSYWWPNIQLWWLHGEKPSENKRYKNNQIALCATHWSHNVKEIRSCRLLLGKRYMEIRYESLIQDVRKTMVQILNHCELKSYGKYINLLPRELSNMNSKWRQDLSDKQKRNLKKAIQSTLRSLDYK